ncbi:Signal transduction response regulator, receiver domain, partial [Dillenia turbinata]
IAPMLFIALSIIPRLSQVSYMGQDGLFFSYHNEADQTLAVFSNKSFSSRWYTQPVNRDTGKLYGAAIGSESAVRINSSWVRDALKSKNGHSAVGKGWSNGQNLFFFNTVAMDGRGLITLGYSVDLVIDEFANIDYLGGEFYMVTKDGIMLMHDGHIDAHILVYNDTISVEFLGENGNVVGMLYGISCMPNQGEVKPHKVNIKGKKYVYFCSTIDVAGVQSVYLLAFPKSRLVDLVERYGKDGIGLLVLMFISVVVSIVIFMILAFKAAKREMFLCAALIKQMEATQQAERKSMNKSLAFAGASHDVRSSLAAITGLIESCQEEAAPNSEMAENLEQMSTCSMDLLGILNTVLDTSKIEAGKMQLVEEDFNMPQLLEEVIDMYYPIGMKKGVDVVLDLCEGSVLKSHMVKGDRGKLKQILINLISNGVKFTSEGHVSLRAYVRKASLDNSIIIASNGNLVLKCLSRLCYKSKDSLNNLDALHTVQQNPNAMEFVFEVDDSGQGIPKDKQKSVFENFVQVKGTALAHEGCGLGLGIVQSLVRLMGGEIEIVDKDPGERGTCFQFNVFLSVLDNISANNEDEEGVMGQKDGGASDFFQIFNRSPVSKSDGSYVVLLMGNDERRKVSKKFIESFGIKVSAIKREKDMFQLLERIRYKSDFFYFNTSCEIPSSGSGSIFSFKETSDHAIAHYIRNKICPCFLLIVIDAKVDLLSEVCLTLATFKKEIPSARCKTIWLGNPFVQTTKMMDETCAPIPCDHIISKPFHGSRICQMLQLLPEFGGSLQCEAQDIQCLVTSQTKASSSHCEHEIQRATVHECKEEQSGEKPLAGKKVLVVEDIYLLGKLTARSLRKLGADIEVCENGQKAFDVVQSALAGEIMPKESKSLPYDIIFMDCEMPVMNGYEATRCIRVEEKKYGVHIPIVALTANAMVEDTARVMEAGMDFHLTKPLQVGKLLDVIGSIFDPREENHL